MFAFWWIGIKWVPSGSSEYLFVILKEGGGYAGCGLIYEAL